MKFLNGFSTNQIKAMATNENARMTANERTRMKTRLDEMLRAIVPPLVVREVTPFQLISDVNDVNFDSRLRVTWVYSFIACVNSNGDKYDNLAARLHRTSISAESNVIHNRIGQVTKMRRLKWITFGWFISYTFIFEINFTPFGHFITMMNWFWKNKILSNQKYSRDSKWRYIRFH